MALILLQLSLCVVNVIQLTSSQSTYDASQQENEVSSCGRSEEVLSQLVTAVTQLQQNGISSSNRSDQLLNQLMSTVSQLQTTVTQVQTAVTRLQANMTQLQTDNAQLRGEVAEVKAAVIHTNVTGKLRNQKDRTKPVRIFIFLIFFLGGGSGILGTNDNFGGNYLRYCTYRKIIAAKMVFVRFCLGGERTKAKF